MKSVNVINKKNDKKTKQCKDCNEIKSITEFHKNRKRCKICRKNINAKFYKNNKYKLWNNLRHYDEYEQLMKNIRKIETKRKNDYKELRKKMKDIENYILTLHGNKP